MQLERLFDNYQLQGVVCHNPDEGDPLGIGRAHRGVGGPHRVGDLPLGLLLLDALAPLLVPVELWGVGKPAIGIVQDEEDGVAGHQGAEPGGGG